MIRRNRPRAGWGLLFLPLLVLVGPLWNALKQDEFDRALREAAGPDATNCGLVSRTDNGRAVTACIVESYEAHRPFFFRNNLVLETASPDFLAMGGAGTLNGKLYNLYYDSPGKVVYDHLENPHIVDSASGVRVMNVDRCVIVPKAEVMRGR